MATQSRSVLDYDTEESLRRALLSVELLDDDDDEDISQNSDYSIEVAATEGGGGAHGAGSAATATAAAGAGDHQQRDKLRSCINLEGLVADQNILCVTGGCDLDWVLPDADQETSEVQSIEQELKRLQVLKSYLLLDSERDKCFERYTNLASSLFECPVSMISLIDIGRAWILANVGVDERIREGPRKLAFCAHTILSASGVMVISDSLKDPRFCNSPYAAEGGIRFYAGVSLVCPEGYKIGTICVVDSEPRPNGISDKQLQYLKDLGAMLVDTMVARRKRIEQDASTQSAELIACTSHDLLTPLSGVLLSLSLLKDDETVHHRLDHQQLDLLSTASTCTDFVVRLCESAIDSLRSSAAGDSADGSAGRQGAGISSPKPTGFIELIKSFRIILEPIPRRVPLVIRVDESTPAFFACDELKLFRCALNLISSAVARTNHGSVYLGIRCQQGELLFECQDTAPSIPESQYAFLYKPCSAKDGDLRLSLSSIGRTVQSLGGICGFYPRGEAGSAFWFRVPAQQNDTAGSLLMNAARRRDPVIGKPAETTPAMASAPAQQPVSNLDTEPSKGASSLQSLYNNVVSTPGAAYTGRKRDERTSDPAPPVVQVNGTHPAAFGPRIATAIATMNRPPTPRSAAPSPRAELRRQRKALVIDDSLVVRKSMGMALKKLGFEVSLAVDGLEGLNSMKETAFDLVLCDFLMPVMDGLDCVKQYREWESSQSASSPARRPQDFRQLIVGISAHADSSVATQGLAAGMNDFRSKPIGVKILKELAESDAVRAVSKILDSDNASQGTSNVVENDADSVVSSRGANLAKFSPSLPPARSMQSLHVVGSHDVEMVDASSMSASKRFRSDRGWRNAEPNCLIVAAPLATGIRPYDATISRMESHGWKVSSVHEPSVAFQMLQTRNWDAVLVDGDLDCLVVAPNESFVTKFRTWERQNRVNMQKNVCWLTDLPLPPLHETTLAVVLPPLGFDRVLQKPLVWEDLEYVVQGHTESHMTIVVNR